MLGFNNNAVQTLHSVMFLFKQYQTGNIFNIPSGKSSEWLPLHHMHDGQLP